MKRQFVCATHSSMLVGFFMYLIMNDFYETWMFVCCCCNLMTFYDLSECVMNVLGTTEHF